MTRRLLLAGAVLAQVSLCRPVSADGVYAPPVPPPSLPLAEFRWTGCYGGLHLGGAWASRDLTDPVQLVQDQISGAPVTTGVTTVTTSPSGWLIGGQIGCDYQFASHWVVGAEAAASATSLKGNSVVGLPAGNPGELEGVTARSDFIPTFTGRLGYAWDTWLLYAKGGYARISDSYSLVGTFKTSPFNFQGLDFSSGWTVGAGLEKALWGPWSVRLEYDYYDFGHRSVLMTDSTNFASPLSGPMDAKQTIQSVRLGLNFHPW
jgi:opacity protein-like surface antigen